MRRLFKVSPIPRFFPKVLQNIFIVGQNPCRDDVMIALKLNNEENQKQDEIGNIISLKEDWKDNPAIFALFVQNQLIESQEDREKSIQISLKSGVLSKYTKIRYVQNPVEVEEEPYYGCLCYEENTYIEAVNIYEQMIMHLKLMNSSIEIISGQMKPNDVFKKFYFKIENNYPKNNSKKIVIFINK